MTLDEAIELANRTEYGLTAGIFSEDEREIEQFFDRIQAGVTYANRRAGATTGAWPGINSFGGWKASGSTGRGTGGPYYVQQFMREQSRVIGDSLIDIESAICNQTIPMEDVHAQTDYWPLFRGGVFRPRAQARRRSADGVTVFEGARLIVGDGRAPIENSAFIVENNRFTPGRQRGDR